MCSTPCLSFRIESLEFRITISDSFKIPFVASANSMNGKLFSKMIKRVNNWTMDLTKEKPAGLRTLFLSEPVKKKCTNVKYRMMPIRQRALAINCYQQNASQIFNQQIASRCLQFLSRILWEETSHRKNKLKV